MPHCYMLSVCRSSSVDRDSNRISLFLMVEELRFSADKRPDILGLEVHCHWLASEDEIGKEFELRVQRIAEDGTEEPGPSVIMVPRSVITRNKFFALKTPEKFGLYKLYTEWRLPSDEGWTRGDVYWPIVVNEIKPPEPKPAPILPSTSSDKEKQA